MDLFSPERNTPAPRAEHHDGKKECGADACVPGHSSECRRRRHGGRAKKRSHLHNPGLSFEIHTQAGPRKTSFQLFFFLCTLPILHGLLALESRSKASFDQDPCYTSLENWIKLLTSRDLSLCMCLSSYGRQHARSREHREH